MQSIRTMLHESWGHIRELSANTNLFIGSVVFILAMVLFVVSLQRRAKARAREDTGRPAGQHGRAKANNDS